MCSRASLAGKNFTTNAKFTRLSLSEKNIRIEEQKSEERQWFLGGCRDQFLLRIYEDIAKFTGNLIRVCFRYEAANFVCGS